MPTRTATRAATRFTRILALCSLATVTFSGCAAEFEGIGPNHTTTTSASPTPTETMPTWPTLASVDPSYATDYSEIEVRDDEHNALLVAPQFPGLEVLTFAMTSSMDERVGQYLGTPGTAPAAPAAQPPANPPVLPTQQPPHPSTRPAPPDEVESPRDGAPAPTLSIAPSAQPHTPAPTDPAAPANTPSPSAQPSATPVPASELTGQWSLIGLSDSALGVALTTTETRDGESTSVTDTFWYSAETNSVLAFDEVLNPEQAAAFQGALADEIAATLPAEPGASNKPGASVAPSLNPTPDGTAAPDVAELAPSYFGFTSDGDLLVGFEPGTIAPARYGSPAFALSWAEAEAWLTPAGTALHDAAVAPVQGAKPQPPAPQTSGDGGVDCNVAKCVALTFDDGPSIENDPRLLDILAQHHAVATFFMLGTKVQSNPEMVAQVAAAGNEIGNHSATHASFTTLTDAEIRQELETTNAAIRDATGTAPVLMRPPYGDTNDHVEAAIESEGLTQTLWTVDTLDWQHRDPNQTYQHVVNDTKPGGIILMHDIHSTSVDAVAKSIEWLQGQGYTLVTVSDLWNN